MTSTKKGWRRAERLLRSSLFATPFALMRLLTRFEIEGREHLDRELARCRQSGRGLITISNHLSLFDDPFVMGALLGHTLMNCERKTWWSTPCESNFSPRGDSWRAKLVRTFSDISNMVFFARPSKKIIEVPDDYTEALEARGVDDLIARLDVEAAAYGVGTEEVLRRFITPGDPMDVGTLNQVGMIEACARISCGDWLHFFPEGTRSRSLELRMPRRGVGKAIYHSPDATVLPFCFYGTQDIMPIGRVLPRPLQRVVVKIGEPVPAGELAELRQAPPSLDSYQALVEHAWGSVVELRERTLANYLRRPVAPRVVLAPEQARVPMQPTLPTAPQPHIDAPVAPAYPARKPRRTSYATIR